jgi:glycosyltransferase involved in cell wall biosynthesis
MNGETPKRLTYIVNFLSADNSQHWVHIPHLLSEMEKLGWEVDLVSERGGQGTAEILGKRVTFLSRNSRWLRLFPLVGHLLKMRRRNGRIVYVRISKSAAFVSAFLGRLLGWRTVYWLSDTVVDFNAKRLGWKGPFEYYTMWTLFRLADRLVTGPERIVDYFQQQYRLPRRKIELLYNDLDLEGIQPAQAGDGDEVRVLLVHWLSPRRDTMRYFPGMLAALERESAKGRKVQLDIVGGGPEQPLLERFAADHPGRVLVNFHGALPNRELGAFYGRATIFVMPSYREGFPRVILEAMARGLPMVTTDAGGTRDICGPEQQAYVTDREDGERFGEAVERLLSSREDRRRIGAENLITVRRFSTPEVAKMYDRALSTLIGARPES